jgi:hypothetical protein
VTTARPFDSGDLEAVVSYPVTFEVVDRPLRFQRRHVFLRLLILLLASLLFAFAWFIALVYVAVPVLAAGFVSRDGERFLDEGAPRMARGLAWIVAFDAYLTLLTDRLPSEEPGDVVRYEVRFSGEPSVKAALLRLLYSIPSGLVLAALGVAAALTGIVAGIMVLAGQDYPDALYRFHLGVVRWGARLLAYHAALVGRYPPFALDMRTGPA